jgi:hypothetical protein
MDEFETHKSSSANIKMFEKEIKCGCFSQLGCLVSSD